MNNGMSETPAKPDPDQDDIRPGAGRLYLLVELLAIVVFVVALIWLMQNYRPRSFLGRGLIEFRLWILVLFVSALGTSGSLIPYYVGQRGGPKPSLSVIPSSRAGPGRGSRPLFKSGER